MLCSQSTIIETFKQRANDLKIEIFDSYTEVPRLEYELKIGGLISNVHRVQDNIISLKKMSSDRDRGEKDCKAKIERSVNSLQEAFGGCVFCVEDVAIKY